MDLYPVKVVSESATWRKARIYFRDGRVRVWAVQRGKAELVLDASEADLQANGRRNHWTLAAAGQTYDVAKEGGCGCGSPLRRLNPAAEL